MATKKKKKQELISDDAFMALNTANLRPIQETYEETAARHKQEKAKKKQESTFSAFNDGYDFGDVTRTILKGGKKLGQATVGAFKKSSYFDDGYDFGDITKTTFSTAKDLGVSATKGFMKASESISDWGYNKLGDIEWALGFEDRAMQNWQTAMEDSTSSMAQSSKHILAGDLGGELSNKTVNQAYQEMYEKNKKGSLISRKGEEYVEEIARMATIAGYGSLTGGQAGTDLLFYASAASNAENEARMAGATPEEAWRYSILSGTAEMLTEKMFGGLGKISDHLGVSKGVAEQFTNKLTNKITNTFFRNLAEYGISATGEGFEEVASGFLDAYAKKLTYMKDADIKQLLADQDLMEQFVQGTVTSFFMQAPNFVQSNVAKVDYKTGYTKNEQQVVDKLIQERVDEASKDGKVSGKKYAEIRDKVNEDLKNGDIKVRDIERLLGGETYTNYQNALNEDNKINKRLDELNQKIDEYENLSASEKLSRANEYKKWETELESITEEKNRSIENTSNLQRQLSSEVYNLAGKDSNFARSYQDEAQKSVAFNKNQYDYDNLSDNKKSLLDSAVNANANNTKAIHKLTQGIMDMMNAEDSFKYEFVNDDMLRESGLSDQTKYKVTSRDTLESIANKNNMTVEQLKKLNNNISSVKAGQELNVYSKNVTNGLVIKKDNKILINLDAVNRLETVVGHEMTHLIEKMARGKATGEYGDYRKSLFEYAEKKGDLEKIRKEFERLYKDQNLTQEELDQEITAELSGRYLFSDEKFLKLVAEDRANTKIRDFIDDLVTKFTGTEEEQQLRELQKKYRDAYQNRNKSFKEGKNSREIQLSKFEKGRKFDYNIGEQVEGEQLVQLKSYGKNVVNDTKNYYLVDNDGLVLDKIKNIKKNKDIISVLESEYNGRTNEVQSSSEDIAPIKSGLSDSESNLFQIGEEGWINRYLDYLSEKHERNRDNRGEDNQLSKSTNELNDTRFSLSEIQGLEGYTEQEIKDISNNYIQNILTQNGIDDVEIVDSAIHGSRNRGTARADSDLDLVVQYEGDIREDDLFNALNDNGEDNLYIEGIKVDINPIQEDLSSYMERSNKYDQEILNKDIAPVNEKVQRSLSPEAIKNLADITGESYSMLEANLGDDEYSVKNYLTRHTKLVDKYMRDNNINVEPVMKPTGLEKHSKEYREFIKDNDITVLKLAKDEQLLNKYFDIERQEFDFPDKLTEKLISEQRERFDYAKSWDEVPVSLQSYEEEFDLIKNDTKEIVDDWETEKKIQKEVVESPEFQKYLDKLVQPLFHKEAHTVEEVMEEAKYNHGTTDNYEVGAYMTTDGELLDFGDHGYRDDHRNVDAFNLDMNEFMEYGAIRMKPESNGFELAQEPTSEQYSKLYDYIDDYCKNNPNNGDIVVDVDTSKNNYDSQFYNINTPTSKIINDIKEYYKTGSFPKQSEFADFRYSLSVQEANTTQDNEGRKLTDNQLAYFKDSKAVDENGNLITVYHTTTEKVAQFNEFNPTGTDYYKFGDQVVNYFTDDKTMSGSYADQYYEMADTKKLTSLEEVNDYLKQFNDSFNTEYNPSGNADYVVREENGKYNVYNEVEKEIIDSAKEFIDTLNEEEKEFIKKYIQDGASKVLFEDRYGLTPEQESYIGKYENWAFNQYSPKSLSKAPQNYLAMLLMGTYNNRPIASYDSKEQLFRNIKTDLEVENYDKRSRLQYEGYANITNPYIIDAEGRTWNKVESKADSDFTKELMKVTPEDRQFLESLASDSIKTYNDNLFNYQQAERAVNDFAVDRTNTTLEQRLVHRTIHDLGFEEFMKILNNKQVFWGHKEQFMDDMFNNGISSYQEKQEFNKTGKIPPQVLEKVNKLIHDPARYEDRYMKRELEALNMPPEIKTTTIYDLWNNQQETYKTFDEGGRYEYSKFNNVVNEKNLYRALDNEALFKIAKRGFTDENIRLLYNDWSVTNDIVKSIIELNKVGENYDGVIIRNVIDYGGESEVHEPHDLYVTFNSNQFKAVDNLNPTEDADIRYSISDPNNIAPIGEGTYSQDVKLQETQMDRIENQLNELSNTLERINNNIPRKTNVDVDGFDLNLEPFMDMINNSAQTEADMRNVTQTRQNIENNLKLINDNFDRIKGTLVEQGLPVDAAQDFIENVVNKYDRQYRETLENSGKNNKIEKMLLDAQEKFTNRNAWIDKLSKDSGNENIKLLGDMANNSFQEASTNINRFQTDLNGKKIGKGIKDIFEPYSKEGLSAVAEDYLFNRSNIERHKVGKGSTVPVEVSQQLVKDYLAQYPQLKNLTEDIQNYYDNLLTQEVKSGLIDQDTYNLLRGERGIYRSYVPFYPSDVEKRYFDNQGNLKPAQTLKRAKGGASKIMGIQEAMGKQTMAVWNSIRTNQLYQEIINTIGGEEGFGAIIRNEPSNLDQSLYTDTDGNRFLTAFVDGREMTAQISEELYNELSKNGENRIKALEERYSAITKSLQGLSNLRRNILTSYNPTFALFKNPIKDIQDAVLYSRHTTDMLKNLPSAYKELWTGNTETVQQFLALYGSNEYQGIGKGYAKVSEMIELAPRYAEFKASIQNGDSVAKAIYNARDITTNFGRGGYVTKALNRNGFTFLNASVQGFSKLVRNFTEQPNARQFAMAVGKAALLGIVPAVFNELAFGGGDDKDEDYEALPDYIKDNYYVFKLGDNADYDDGTGAVISVGGSKFLRIPKGRALSIFGSAARRTIELAEGDENAFEGYWKNAWSQVGPVEIAANPLDNTIFAPIAQVAGGEKTSGGNTTGRAWYGGDIVPTRLQGERPEDQYDASVDKFSIWLGGKTGWSPYKINYVLDQYSGGIGDVILPMITEETKNGAETPLDYLIAPVRDQLVVNSIDDNKYASEFYSTKEKLYKGSKATDEEKLRAQYMDDVSWDLSSLYKEKRAVQSDNSLSKKEKYAKVQAIQSQINDIARAGLNMSKTIDVSGSYASVSDDRAYYKNAKGQWTAIPQEDLTTVESLGMTDAEKSNYFDASNALYNIYNKYKEKKEGKSETEQIELNIKQKKERLDTIKNSPLSDNAKYALFDKNYDDKLLSYYEDLGFKANDVLTYKSQTFTADKDKKGKTINNSKKKKVVKYINSMNIPTIQKKILYKKEYKADKSYDREIFNYINNSDMDYSSKKAVLKELGINAR